MHGTNDFAKVFKNIIGYRSENDFIVNYQNNYIQTRIFKMISKQFFIYEYIYIYIYI